MDKIVAASGDLYFACERFVYIAPLLNGPLIIGFRFGKVSVSGWEM
jgi:hypothetical protein